MSDAVTGDAISKAPEVDPDDPAAHAEAQSGSEVQSASQDVGMRLGDDEAPAAAAGDGAVEEGGA